MAAHLYDRLISVCVAPAGIAHLERAELTTDLTMARDFDLGMMGPPLAISMDFIAAGLGRPRRSVPARRSCWSAFHVVGARSLLAARGWLDALAAARERRVEGPQHRRGAQGRSDTPSTRTGWRSTPRRPRSCGSSGWPAGSSIGSSTTGARLYELQYEATRLRERSVLACLVIVLAANVVVFWLLADGAADGDASTAPGRGLRAGGDRRVGDRVRWTELGARRRRGAGGRARPARGRGGRPARLCRGHRAMPRRAAKEIRFRDVTFAYPTVAVRCSTAST